MPQTLAEFYFLYPFAFPALSIFGLVFILFVLLKNKELKQGISQLNQSNQTQQTELALLQQQLRYLNESLQDLQQQSADTRKRSEQIQLLSNQLHIKNTELTQQLSALANNHAQTNQVNSDLKSALDVALARKNQLTVELESLKVAFAKEQKHSDEKLDELEKNRQILKKEFSVLANDILKTSQHEFKEKSLSDMGAFLQPFKEQVSDFKNKVEHIHTQDLKQRAELKAELTNLQLLNKDITHKAEELTNALKGQKKTQGNWGELILENVLDRSGLIDGKDFKRQPNFNTEEGKQIPDVVIYLPEDKHLVVDAKVSLNAYTRYVNADDDLQRQQALNEHVAAVSARIKELSDKNYFGLPGLNSPEMVFMFIPIESAFVEAVKAEDALFQQAIEQKILIATPTTLLTSLNIVRQLWRFEDQNKHSAQLAMQAGKIFSKLSSILEGLDKLGVQLDKSKDTWTEAMKQFVNGRGNLVKQVKDFEKMGVSVQKELPPKLVEQSKLEMD